jgi:hypothetical protein
MTELEAVNICLRYISERPVTTLVGIESNSVANMAYETLQEVSTEVQSSERPPECYERNYELALTGGEAVLPAGAIHMDASNHSQRYVLLAGKLYDMTEHTNTITEDPLDVDIIWERAWDDLQEQTQRLIALRATRETAIRRGVEDSRLQRILGAEQEARTNFLKNQMRTNDYTFPGDARSLRARFYRRRRI